MLARYAAFHPKWLSDNQYGTQTAWCWNPYT